MFKYLHENGCPWKEDIVRLLLTGRLGVSNTRTKMVVMGYAACFEAVSIGHLECLKYLHENGCSWNAKTCKAAAENGHLECLKYLHEKRVSLGQRDLLFGCRKGSARVFEIFAREGMSWE